MQFQLAMPASGLGTASPESWAPGTTQTSSQAEHCPWGPGSHPDLVPRGPLTAVPPGGRSALQSTRPLPPGCCALGLGQGCWGSVGSVSFAGIKPALKVCLELQTQGGRCAGDPSF